MPISSPDLDDLRFDRTVEELTRRIPVYAPEWTDFNESDPGIALIQLFAYLAEQIGYRLNRIPEKNQVELLRLLGVELQPALPAHTRLALLLTDPRTLVGYTLREGALARAKTGSPPPLFETDRDVDVVPAEMGLLVTTKNPFLQDVLLLRADGARETPASLPAKVPAPDTEWLTVAWDGKAPKLKEMPGDPVPIFKRDEQTYLWVGVRYNPSLEAGFRGARVTLTVQLDDDEKPRLDAEVLCEDRRPPGELPPVIDWLWYWDAADGAVKQVPGQIEDTTGRLTRSGAVSFGVPLTIGKIADDAWAGLRSPATVGPLDACRAVAETMDARVRALPPLGTVTAGEFNTVLSAGVLAARDAADAAKPPLPHPLDPALRGDIDAWFRIGVAARDPSLPPPRVRMVTFNAGPATQAVTVRNELLGKGTGRAGQQLALSHRNVLAGSLVVGVQEDSDPTTPLVTWSETKTLDAAGPFDSVFELDAEAGVLTFGDGRRGRIPPLVPRTGDIVALSYRWGGGLAGELPLGGIEQLDTAAPGIANAVNVVAATGGRDAETLDQAEERARKAISSRDRAVTAADFEWIAKQTPLVRVARVQIVPLRRPLPASTPVPAPVATRCGTLPAGPAGLSPDVAPGAVSVVVVPDEPPNPEPTPTASFLRAVCLQLDDHRLVTTEVHVVPPQFCRLCNVVVRVAGKPGYTRSQLQALVAARLGAYLHVLRGGEDGAGFPFGGQLHLADLMSLVARVEGVERVEQVSAEFTRTKSNAAPRQGRLVLCPAQSDETDRVQLAPEENVSIDVTSINLGTV